MRLLRHDLRLVAGDYHLQRVASDDKGLRPYQGVAIVVDSAESLATNFNDAVAIIVDSAESLATNFNHAVAIVVDSAESLATNFNDAVAIVVGSAESLATNFNDARLSSRPAESSSPKPKTTQTATIRQETTQTATIRQETTSRTAFWTLPNRLPGI